jgi:hypothetical protein
MPKVLTNSRDNILSIYGAINTFNIWLDQPVTITSSPTFANLTLTGDAQIDGNLTVSGNTTIIDTDAVLIKDNIIEINTSEVGNGVTPNLAGLQIERGTLTDYQIVFRESDDAVAIGEIGDLQAIATREDNPMSNGIMSFNSIDRRLDSVDDISIPITFSASVASTSTTTGSLIVTGGVGISGAMYAGSGYLTGNLDVNGVLYARSNVNLATTSGITTIGSSTSANFSATGVLTITNTTTSTSSTTGALKVSGGVGISENLNVGGSSSFGPTQVNTSTGTFSVLGSGSISTLVTGTIDIKSSVNGITIDAQNNALILYGHTSVAIDSTGPVNIDTTNLANGVKIGTETSSVPITIGHSSSEVTIGDNLTVIGDLTINGTTTTVNSTSITVQDNAIIVNSLPNTLSDGGLLVRRYQTANNSGSGGQVVLDTPDTTSTFDTGSSTPSTLVLNSSASAVNDYYNGWWINITSGAGNNQIRRIKSYNGTTKTAIVYITSENTATFLDGLDIVTAPASGDSYNLYSGTYSGVFYDDTNDEWALGKVPRDSGAGTFPLVEYQDLHVKGLTVETITGFVTNPSLTTSNLTNVSSILQSNVSLISTTPDRTLSGCFRVTPTASFLATSFEFNLTGVVTSWNNPYDITITLNGNHDNVNFYSVENVVGYAVAGTTRAKVKFTAGSTSEHVIHFIVRYTIV